MQRDLFPWLSHRTLAEVDETERLRHNRRHGTWHGSARARLQVLEARAAQPEKEEAR